MVMILAGNNGTISKGNSGAGDFGSLPVAMTSMLFLVHCLLQFASVYCVSFPVLNLFQRLG